MKITEHFDDSEFKCKCGCNRNYIDKKLVEKLELLRTAMKAHSIVITSGYRCPTHSVNVGGKSTDAHTVGIASDCIVYKERGIPFDNELVAAYAERLGFTGIGLMKGNAIHLDIRSKDNYKNSHWFGDERTGNDNIKTFITDNIDDMWEDALNDKGITITVEINGKTYKGKVYET